MPLLRFQGLAATLAMPSQTAVSSCSKMPPEPKPTLAGHVALLGGIASSTKAYSNCQFHSSMTPGDTGCQTRMLVNGTGIGAGHGPAAGSAGS